MTKECKDCKHRVVKEGEAWCHGIYSKLDDGTPFFSSCESQRMKFGACKDAKYFEPKCTDCKHYETPIIGGSKSYMCNRMDSGNYYPIDIGRKLTGLCGPQAQYFEPKDYGEEMLKQKQDALLSMVNLKEKQMREWQVGDVVTDENNRKWKLMMIQPGANNRYVLVGYSDTTWFHSTDNLTDYDYEGHEPPSDQPQFKVGDKVRVVGIPREREIGAYAFYDGVEQIIKLMGKVCKVNKVGKFISLVELGMFNLPSYCLELIKPAEDKLKGKIKLSLNCAREYDWEYNKKDGVNSIKIACHVDTINGWKATPYIYLKKEHNITPADFAKILELVEEVEGKVK